jgi:hypothetical protein
MFRVLPFRSAREPAGFFALRAAREPAVLLVVSFGMCKSMANY